MGRSIRIPNDDCRQFCPDLGGNAGTTQMGDAIAAAVVAA